MNSDKDIIEYLNEFENEELMTSSALFNEIKNEVSFIKNHPLNSSPDLKKLKKLNELRLNSSNTLAKARKASDIEAWNSAQAVLCKLIDFKNFLELEDVQTLNASLSNTEGALRTFSIETGAGEYLSHNLIHKTLTSFFKINRNFESEPLRQAFELYLHIVTVHPFEDANGRTARLAADFYLFKNNLLPVYFKSPIQSHVALVKNNVKRTKDESFLKFLKGVKNSYELIFE